MVLISLRNCLKFLALLLLTVTIIQTSARADVLAVPGSATATLPTGGSKTYTLTVPSDGDVNFTVTNSSSLYSLLRFIDSNGVSQINYVYTGYGSSNSVSIPHLAPGTTYSVRVEAYAGSGSFTVTDTFTATGVANDTETNDTPATGTALVLNSTLTGHVGYSRSAYNTLDTIDYYKVLASGDGDLTFNLNTTGTLYALVRFWDSNGTTQIGYVYVGYGSSNSLVIPHLSSAATYYVSVENYSGYGGYTLTNTFVKPTVAKDVEKNDTPATGRTLLIGGTVTGHVGYSRTAYNTLDTIDYYKVKTTADGDLKMNFTTNGTLYALARFWDSDGVTQIGYQYVGYGSSNSLVIPHLSSAATYYVSVENYSGYGTYKIASTFTKPPQTKDVEKNDTSLTALAFPLNSTMTGHLGYSRNKYSVLDTIDYYKVTVSGTGNLNISLSTSGTLYGLVRIWGTNGTTQINYVYVGFGSSNSVSTALPAGGTYYVSVEAYSGYGGYTLKNTF